MNTGLELVTLVTKTAREHAVNTGVIFDTRVHSRGLFLHVARDCTFAVLSTAESSPDSFSFGTSILFFPTVHPEHLAKVR